MLSTAQPSVATLADVCQHADEWEGLTCHATVQLCWRERQAGLLLR